MAVFFSLGLVLRASELSPGAAQEKTRSQQRRNKADGEGSNAFRLGVRRVVRDVAVEPSRGSSPPRRCGAIR